METEDTKLWIALFWALPLKTVAYIRLNGEDSALLMMLVGYNIGMVWTKSRALFNGCYLVQCFLHHPMVRVLTGTFA